MLLQEIKEGFRREAFFILGFKVLPTADLPIFVGCDG
jgi:hypothetical protein